MTSPLKSGSAALACLYSIISGTSTALIMPGMTTMSGMNIFG
ncbi:Uncharacterised protein [Mycobacteroides abscessus subsp. abscessus]|nr:Uncharacterised protein [Mycobacteroides abscessus subsp. abscessus]